MKVSSFYYLLAYCIQALPATTCMMQSLLQLDKLSKESWCIFKQSRLQSDAWSNICIKKTAQRCNRGRESPFLCCFLLQCSQTDEGLTGSIASSASSCQMLWWQRNKAGQAKCVIDWQQCGMYRPNEFRVNPFCKKTGLYKVCTIKHMHSNADKRYWLYNLFSHITTHST